MVWSYDAIVIGGGPAGSLTTLQLARAGWETLLVDRRQPKAAKTCGHCLNARALPMLERAGLRDETLKLSRGTTRGMHLCVESAAPWSVPLRGSNTCDSTVQGESGLLVERSRFDQMLVDKAVDCGVSIARPAAARVTAFRNGASRVEIRSRGDTIEARAPLIVGADGLGSRVARAARIAPRSRCACGCKFGFSFSFTSPRASLIERNVIAMFVCGGGYLGVVNHGDGRLHVAAMIDGAGSRLPRPPHQVTSVFASRFPLLDRIGLGSLTAPALHDTCGTAPMPWRPRAAANKLAALVGDAAGYVEPFTGEGMTWAIESAELLADALADVRPGTWSARLAARYQSLWQTRISAQQRRCRAIAWLVARPRLMRLAVNFMQRRPRLGEHIVQLAAPA